MFASECPGRNGPGRVAFPDGDRPVVFKPTALGAIYDTQRVEVPQ
jgi:hypothetical protein